MSSEPRHSTDGREVTSYETMVANRPILIAIDRETIEDWLGVETTTPEERLALVNQEMPVLTRCAAEALRNAPDASGIMLKLEHLPSRARPSPMPVERETPNPLPDKYHSNEHYPFTDDEENDPESEDE